jgi:CDP-diacylglycerol--glycerol-3-phosphate 3-phosphatidyltransferase
VVSDAALYLPLLVLPGVHAIWVALFVLLAVMSEMAGVIGAALGGSRRYDGPMGKGDRAVVMGALGLAIGCGAPGGGWLNVLLVALSALLVITIVNRVKRGLREIDG